MESAEERIKPASSSIWFSREVLERLESTEPQSREQESMELEPKEQELQGGLPHLGGC